MTNPATIREQIRAMGMSEEKTRAAIQDFERGERIVQVLCTAARLICRAVAETAWILRWFILTFSHRPYHAWKAYKSRYH